MTRPGIVRADTLDLQDQLSPSAQDHTRQPEHVQARGSGPAGPHLRDAVRHVNEERSEERENLSEAYSSASSTRSEERSLTDAINDELEERQQEQGLREGRTSSDGEDEGDGEDILDDDMMDKISSSPSIDDEDIDFEFVYALHTFVATVEGQANATKGDTMVLLDDSNSYWWLVRIVKDSSIGYLPAEHIETPTERLARLNKHRNIDLSATMLGDASEKSRNPIKKVMKKRNAKSVAFAAPTYVEASDVDYSSDEDMDGETLTNGNVAEANGAAAAAQNGQQRSASTASTATANSEQDKAATVEPLRLNGARNDPAAANANNGTAEPATRPSDDTARSSEEMFRDGPSKSRNGTVRNTDSFFKDDSVETRKITLTPNLLRDDSPNAPRPQESPKSSMSSDGLEKTSPVTETAKRDKKAKDKRPGMLSGLFKSKKKNSKIKIDELSDADGEGPLSPRAREFGVISPTEAAPPTGPAAAAAVARTSSKGKLQKPPPGAAGAAGAANVRSPPSTSPKNSPQLDGRDAVSAGAAGAAAVAVQQQQQRAERDHMASPQPGSRGPVAAASAALAASEPVTQPQRSPIPAERAPEPQQQQQALQPRAAEPEREQRSTGKTSPLAALIGGNRSSEPKPEKTKKAKHRVELDDFDSSPDESSPVREMMPGSFGPISPSPDHGTANHDGGQKRATIDAEHLASSPGDISPVDPGDNRPPSPLSLDTSKGALSNDQQDEPVSPESPPRDARSYPTRDNSYSSAPRSATAPQPSPRSTAPMNPYATRSTPAPNLSTARSPPPSNSIGTSPSPPAVPPVWSDAALQKYFDPQNSAVRDLLLVVSDKSGVSPAAPDHPLMKTYLVEERKSVDALERQLDRMLGEWVGRRKGSPAVTPRGQGVGTPTPTGVKSSR